MFHLDWKTDPTQLTIIAFSRHSQFVVRLPSGDLHLIIHIRDTLDCIAEYNVSSVSVSFNVTIIRNLMKSIEGTTSPFVQLLSSGSEQIIGQVINSIVGDFNQMNNESIDKAMTSKVQIRISLSLSFHLPCVVLLI